MPRRKQKLYAKISLSVIASSILIGSSQAHPENCEWQKIVNLLPDWADRIEEEYSRTVDYEIMVKDELNHIRSWGDANVGDIWFEVIDEMRELAKECEGVND